MHVVLSNLHADLKQPANLDFPFPTDAQAASSDVEAGDGETMAAERLGFRASAASSDSVRLQILQPLKQCLAAAATKAGTAVDVAFARSGDAPAIEAVWLRADGPASASMAADPATAAAAAAATAYPGAVPQRQPAPEAPVPTASEGSEAAPSAAAAPALLHPGTSCCGGKAASSAAPQPYGDGTGRPGALPQPAGAAGDAAGAAAPPSVPAVEAAAAGAAPGSAAPRDAAGPEEEAAQQSAEAAAQPRSAPCCRSVSLDLERSTSTVWVSAPSMELSDCLRPGSAVAFAARNSGGGRDGGVEGVAPSTCGDGDGAGPAAGAVEVAADYTDAAAAAEPTGSGDAASSGAGSCSSGGTPWYRLAAILLQGWVS